MAGLDVTARWELLTWCDDLVPKPDSDNGSLRPPTEMNATVNPEYGFVETFDHIPFTDGEDAVLPPRRSICEPLEVGEEEVALGFPTCTPCP